MRLMSLSSCHAGRIGRAHDVLCCRLKPVFSFLSRALTSGHHGANGRAFFFLSADDEPRKLNREILGSSSAKKKKLSARGSCPAQKDEESKFSFFFLMNLLLSLHLHLGRERARGEQAYGPLGAFSLLILYVAPMDRPARLAGCPDLMMAASLSFTTYL